MPVTLVNKGSLGYNKHIPLERGFPVNQILSSLGITADLSELNLGSLTLEKLLGTLLTFLFCIIAGRIVQRIFRKLLSKSKADERARKYALAGIRVLLWVITVLIVADQLGIPVTSLVALLSVFSLAVSLAIQSVLANIAGGIVLFLSKPFKEGDFVETTSGTGDVKEITLNYTYLETTDGLRVVVPNSTLSADRIINYTALGRRRVTVTVTASYDAPTETVRAACMSAIARTEFTLSDPAPEVLLNNYGASNIEYLVRVWCTHANYGAVRFSLTEHLRTAFAEYGVEMTYDHLNVHLVDKK